ncbi:MAG: hypothetical protein MRY83_08810 [Flavobacteriales bacterium]|nr:hypothetical protein [Flavobacteriales bacterium]
MKKWIFRLSILLNVFFILAISWNWINSPSNELGRLEKDIEIGYFQSGKSVFRIPKGLTVRNISQRGLSAIGQFENERFSILITPDDASLVNYDLPKDSLDTFGNSYSAGTPQNSLQDGIPQGNFIYELYFAEFCGRIKNAECKIEIDGNKIIVEQTENTNLTGGNEIFSGLILKHKSGKWILTDNENDVNADEIGGCTEIPIIEFEKKQIEWC